MLPPCACLVRIKSPTVLPRRYARRPRRTLRSQDRQRTSRKLSVHVGAFCALCAHHAPHCTAQALRAEAAAYATLARFPSKVFETRPRAKGGRGVRYDCKMPNAHHVSQAFMLPPCARLVRIMPPTVLPRRYARRPWRTLRSHDYHQTILKRGRGRKEAAAYATLERFRTRIT
jgi:hypothetical protein